MAETNFLQYALHEFKTYKNLGDKSIERLSEAELHWQPEPESNSMAIIIRHMYGNMRSRWTNFLTTDGEKADRNRDTEFEDLNETKQRLSEKWEAGWKILFEAISPLTGADLAKTVYIMQQPHTVMQAICRQLAHYSYHVGQMVYLAKQIRGTAWESLSIAKGRSADFNNKLMK